MNILVMLGHAHFLRDFGQKFVKNPKMAMYAWLYTKSMFFDTRNRLQLSSKPQNEYFTHNGPCPPLFVDI